MLEGIPHPLRLLGGSEAGTGSILGSEISVSLMDIFRRSPLRNADHIAARSLLAGRAWDGISRHQLELVLHSGHTIDFRIPHCAHFTDGLAHYLRFGVQPTQTHRSFIVYFVNTQVKHE